MQENRVGEFSESFILGLIAALGGLISLVFASLRKSRCGTINCCYGFFKCERTVLTDLELLAEPPTPSRLTLATNV